MEEEAELGVTDEGDLAFVEELPPAQKSPEDEVVTIDLDKLEEMMAEEMEEEGGLDASEMVDREQVAEELTALAEDDEEVELDEDVLNELLSELGGDAALFSTKGAAKRDNEKKKITPPEAAKEPKSEDPTEKEDLGFQKGRPYKRDLEESEEEELEEERDKRDDMGGGHGDYKKAKQRPNFPYQESLVKENKSLLQEQQQTTKKVQVLKEKLNKYGTVITKLKEKLDESNLTNAKLLYQNRVLNSISLNERQKDKIADAISSATSAEEARIIFETLQSAVGSVTKRSMPESLNEVVTRSSSAFISRREEKQKVDPFAERMKALAGLKNN